MKKTLIIIIVGFILISGFKTVAISQNEKPHSNVLTKIENFTISEPIIQEKNNYLIINFEESTSSFSEVGNPILPVITKTYTFPLGTKILDINIDYETRVYHLEKKIAPCPSPVIYSRYENLETDIILFNNTLYESKDLFPEESILIEMGGGIQNNEHILFCNINVIPQYNPYKNIILSPKDIEITINYLPSKAPLFIPNNEYEMVIITPEKFSKILKPLIDHKNSVGIRTFLKTTDEIYSNYDGRDCVEQIKYFIKDAIEIFGVSYVLLIGNDKLLPIRKTSITGAIPQNLPTDLYYADIYDSNGSFCSWDSNENDIFGEYYWPDSMSFEAEYIDFIDLYPDVAVGRLPCGNNFDVKILVKKIIEYETQTYGKDWFNRMILMGGDTFPWFPDIIEGEYVNDHVAQLMPDFEHIRLWTSTSTFNPQSINQEITLGAGFVSYSGHGSEIGIGTYIPESDETLNYNIANLIGMRNGNKLPIIYYEACLTAKIDYKFKNIVRFPCFAWSTLKNPFGGAIAVIGSTGIGYGGLPGDPLAGGCPRLNSYFFQAYEPGIIISKMFMDSQIQYLNNVWKDYLTLEEFILLGDPSLKIGGYE